jgi:ABC-type nitrate/sulfonate/bicarbonate transport system permease component
MTAPGRQPPVAHRSSSVPVGLSLSATGQGPPTGPSGTGIGREVVRRPTLEDSDPRRFQLRRRRLERTLAWTLPLLVLAAWQVFAVAGWLDRKFFPPPGDIWRTGVQLARSGALWHDTFVSSRRLLYGFGLGSLVGIAVGVWTGTSKLARASLEPLVYALWTVPKLALLPLMLLIFGLGDKPIIVLIAINCFFIMMIPTTGAIVSVDPGYVEVSDSFQASRWQRFRDVLLPAALPQIFIALRLSAGAAVLTLVAAEFVQAADGLGFLIWNSWSLYLAKPMYVGIVVVAALGAIFTLLVGAIGRRLSPWYTKRER